MSLPFYSLSCTNCNYSGRYGFNIRYRVEGLVHPITGVLTQGWCDKCDGVVTIYSPTSFSSVDAQQEICERKEIIYNLTKGIVGKLFKKMSSQRKEQLANIESDIATLQNWSSFIADNPIRNRCLTCGSELVHIVILPNNYLSPTKIGITHHCGGEIIATAEGRIGYGDGCPQVICDINGNILHDERQQRTLSNKREHSMPSSHAPAIERAIDMVSRKYGSLGDLPDEFRQTVWVTAYSASAIGLKIEAGGGSMTIMKSMLIEGGRDARQCRHEIRSHKTRQRICTTARNDESRFV